MPTGIEIAGLVIASTGISGSAAGSKLINYTKKGAAQKVYDDTYRQYEQVKAFREDEVINQFLTEKDRERLDVSIEE
ncbi:hypothetical protein BN14_04559 [Rhizoctonia solani AG-1 IB]|uniref:Uncharacterized protein n=1 Tax=Thanatephorus cucumeris (strain AG1-IB / isolate 7/3/14) TaxID=1108050 RepID=M5BVH2_THACB|nr:hypothetical protein BN14_04559 [Rhizoctonia solani AG-1 IB]